MHPELPLAMFETKRRNFFVKLALKYKQYYKIHQVAGQTQRRSEFGVTKVTNSRGELFEKSKRWGDPTEHCLVEAAAAEELADMLKLAPEEKEKLVIATLVHDAGKKFEIESTKGVTDPEKIEAAYSESEKRLLEHGVSKDVVSLTKKVAHTSLPYFAIIEEGNVVKLKPNLQITEMVMHYIDDITRGTTIVTLDERMDYLDLVAVTRYPYNEKGRVLWGGRTFFQAQREVGHLIEDYLAERAGVDTPKELPHIIFKRLNEKISNS